MCRESCFERPSIWLERSSTINSMALRTRSPKLMPCLRAARSIQPAMLKGSLSGRQTRRPGNQSQKAPTTEPYPPLIRCAENHLANQMNCRQNTEGETHAQGVATRASQKDKLQDSARASVQSLGPAWGDGFLFW